MKLILSTVPPTSRCGRVSRTTVVALFVVGAAIFGWWFVSRKGNGVDEAPDPRLTYTTRFRNVRPEVQFVGDGACAKCHPGHAASYREHPMGRSLEPLAQATPLENYSGLGNKPFSAAGLQYSVERQGDSVQHSERRLQPDGYVIAECSKQVQYAIGAGIQGRSYLFEQDGYLWQSPIAWYRRTGKWDLAPGFARAPSNLHFERKVDARCLFCHTDNAEQIEDTQNRFVTPIFRNHSIGCERCHGPGQLHVQFRENHGEAADVDDTIVNPRHLEPALREAVCQQCHLEPEVMVLRRGRKPFDYRPGMPLHLFYSMFMRANAKGEHKFASQVDQMYVSRCFQESQGRLGCISCHDAHELPASEKKTAYYRTRCLQCHMEKGCNFPMEQRLAISKEDNCIQCHMAQRDSNDIAHSWLSDHRIPRRAKQKEKPESSVTLLRPGESPLILFHQDMVTSAFQPEVNRDLGLALVEVSRRLDSQNRLEARAAVELASKALPLLEAGLAVWPRDIAAREAKALALATVGRPREALVVFDELLATAPKRESALANAGTLAIEVGQIDTARGYMQRAIAINPWESTYHMDLARCYAQQQEWNLTAQECQRAVAISPFHLNARKYLVAAYLQMGDRAKAEAEFKTLLGFNPPDQDALRNWFANQTRRQGSKAPR